MISDICYMYPFMLSGTIAFQYSPLVELYNREGLMALKESKTKSRVYMFISYDVIMSSISLYYKCKEVVDLFYLFRKVCQLVYLISTTKWINVLHLFMSITKCFSAE